VVSTVRPERDANKVEQETRTSAPRPYKKTRIRIDRYITLEDQPELKIENVAGERGAVLSYGTSLLFYDVRAG